MAILAFSMGEAFDIGAVTSAWQRMLQVPDRPALAAWSAQHEPKLRRLSREAWRLEVNAEHRRGLLRAEAALLVDGLLCKVARGRGALALAMGEALASLSRGDRLLRLGYACLGDYARERLGIAGRTAQAMAQLSAALRERPLLRDAVLRGEVSARKALALLPVAFGGSEASWMERARSETARALAEAVKVERGQEEAGEEEAWDRVRLPLSAEQRGTLDEAMVLAGTVVGVPATRHQRLEAMSQEYLGEHGHEGGQGGDEAGEGGGEASQAAGEARQASDEATAADGAVYQDEASAGGDAVTESGVAWSPGPSRHRDLFSLEVEGWLEAVKKELEIETGRWEALTRVDPVAAPRAGEEESPPAIDAGLRRLAGMLARWDELVGHLALVMKFFGLRKEAGFADFDHYCVERLWMAPRTVEQRVWLERRFYDLPGLREAMRSGRLSYEQARLVAEVADAGSVEDWVRRAEGMTCIDLRRTIEGREERQMCAREELSIRVPRRVAELMDAAFRAARRKAGRELSPAECLVEIARHFTETWKGVVSERSTPQRRVRRRDEHCQVPGCSRAALHAHHVIHASQGGPDDPWNLTGVCAAHHLCIHSGWVRVSGRAPDRLVWELGEKAPETGPAG